MAAESKPSVFGGTFSSGSLPPQRSGGARISASVHGALAKYSSSLGQLVALGVIQTCTFDTPEMPT